MCPCGIAETGGGKNSREHWNNVTRLFFMRVMYKSKKLYHENTKVRKHEKEKMRNHIGLIFTSSFLKKMEAVEFQTPCCFEDRKPGGCPLV
jgi:hypothetical protein